MKFAFQYLREHLRIILVLTLFVCIFSSIFYLYHLPLAAVLYPTFICFLVGCLFAVQSIQRAYKKHNRLEEIQSFNKDALRDVFSKSISMEDRDYQRIILKLCQEMNIIEDRMLHSHQETLDYFTMWVHQIKTPIASMRLHLGDEDSKLARRLKSDLLHIEQYVEMVLTYLKMGSESTDYVFHKVSLDKIVRDNIRKLRGDFILKKLKLTYIPIEDKVISDEKWLSFVVEQLLSNALKYTSEGEVIISLEIPKTLCISDTGTGIAPEDIPRIFEKGYTGINGRKDKQASGIGLYLCKQICEQLGHKLSVISEVECGTTIRIDLSQYHNASE